MQSLGFGQPKAASGGNFDSSYSYCGVDFLLFYDIVGFEGLKLAIEHITLR